MREMQNESVIWNALFLRLTATICLIMLAAILSTGLMAQRRSAKSRVSTKVVKTKFPVHYKANIAVSDDIIVYGTGFLNGVEYIKPGDTSSSKIPNGNQFSSKYFAVAGTKIILAKPNSFTLAVFDTATNKMAEIPESTLRIRSIGGSMFMGGSIQSSGNYAAVLTDPNATADKSGFKAIDVSGAEPRVIAFPTKQVFRQVAVDEKTGMVAAAGGLDYSINLFDIKNPNSPPKVVNVKKYNGVGMAQMRFDDGKVLFQTAESYKRAMLLDVASGNITELSRAQHDMALKGGTYVYFAARDSKDSSSITGRAAVGKVGAQPKFTVGATPIGGSKNNGLVGFGASVAITPDGKQIFIAGMETAGRTERLQIYRRGKFALQRDASYRPGFMQASDVVASSRIVAFKTGKDNTTTLAYIKLK